MTNQNIFEENEYLSYQSGRRNRNNPLPQSLGGLPSSVQSLEQHFSRSMELLQTPSLSEDPQACNTRHMINLLEAANETDYQGQRLSLTLGSQLPSHILVQPPGDDASYISGGGANTSSSISHNQSCSTSYETEIFATVIGNSKFLRPTQSLLEETVSVGGKSIDFSTDESIAQLRHSARAGALSLSSQLQAEMYNDGFSSDIQNRITKLISLLDKLDSRYEQYYRRMEELVSSFEMIAGLGAAKSYTALTLQAMSRHFYSLREGILTHIQLAKRHFTRDLPGLHGGQNQFGASEQGRSRDGMSLQQLGMIQNQRQTWRPTRGLPETSVGILRSWLFEHFLHPYPNDSEKLTLASQTGLTKNQVSNWFINARVRLWKPMIEEMYNEELGDSSMDSNQSESMSTTGRSTSDHADT